MITYIKEVKEVLDGLDMNKISKIVTILSEALTVYIFGNGGSLATADHFVVDLLKYANKRAFSCSNLSLMTMVANDYGYDQSFSWMIQRLCLPGDVFVGISTSGKSSNVVKAMLCNSTTKTIFITGKCDSYCADLHLVIPSSRTQIIEDVSLIVCHMIALEMKKRSDEKCLKQSA